MYCYRRGPGRGTDKARFAHAADQINRAGAELTLMLGDMVHQKTDFEAYETMQELVKRFDPRQIRLADPGTLNIEPSIGVRKLALFNPLPSCASA